MELNGVGHQIFQNLIFMLILRSMLFFVHSILLSTGTWNLHMEMKAQTSLRYLHIICKFSSLRVYFLVALVL